MAYTLGSAKDARQDKGFTEPEVLARFVARQNEIQQFAARNHIPLEDAFRAVTGEPWPEGRSVKIKNGVAEMTKDRTFKSVLGKYVAAPAAIGATAAFAPQVLTQVIPHALGIGGGGGLASGHAVNAAVDSLAAGSAGGGGAAAAGGLSTFLKPILQYGVPAATGLIGSHMAANAEERAAELQNRYLERALAVEQENEQYRRAQRADYLARLRPFSDAGTAAIGRANSLLETGWNPAARS